MVTTNCHRSPLENAQFLDTRVNIGLINGVESTGLAYKMPLGIVMRMVIKGKYFRINAQQACQTAGMPYTWTVLTDIQDTEDTKEGFRSFVDKAKAKIYR